MLTVGESESIVEGEADDSVDVGIMDEQEVGAVALTP